MKSMKRNSILPMLVLTSIMGISSCSTDYMAYDVGLKDGIYFITGFCELSVRDEGR